MEVIADSVNSTARTPLEGDRAPRTDGRNFALATGDYEVHCDGIGADGQAGRLKAHINVPRERGR